LPHDLLQRIVFGLHVQRAVAIGVPGGIDDTVEAVKILPLE